MSTPPRRINIERLDNGWVITIDERTPFVVQDDESDLDPFVYDSGQGWILRLSRRS